MQLSNDSDIMRATPVTVITEVNIVSGSIVTACVNRVSGIDEFNCKARCSICTPLCFYMRHRAGAQKCLLLLIYRAFRGGAAAVLSGCYVLRVGDEMPCPDGGNFAIQLPGRAHSGPAGSCRISFGF